MVRDHTVVVEAQQRDPCRRPSASVSWRQSPVGEEDRGGSRFVLPRRVIARPTSGSEVGRVIFFVQVADLTTSDPEGEFAARPRPAVTSGVTSSVIRSRLVAALLPWAASSGRLIQSRVRAVLKVAEPAGDSAQIVSSSSSAYRRPAAGPREARTNGGAARRSTICSGSASGWRAPRSTAALRVEQRVTRLDDLLGVDAAPSLGSGTRQRDDQEDAPVERVAEHTGRNRESSRAGAVNVAVLLSRDRQVPAARRRSVPLSRPSACRSCSSRRRHARRSPRSSPPGSRARPAAFERGADVLPCGA